MISDPKCRLSSFSTFIHKLLSTSALPYCKSWEYKAAGCGPLRPVLTIVSQPSRSSYVCYLCWTGASALCRITFFKVLVREVWCLSVEPPHPPFFFFFFFLLSCALFEINPQQGECYQLTYLSPQGLVVFWFASRNSWREERGTTPHRARTHCRYSLLLEIYRWGAKEED